MTLAVRKVLIVGGGLAGLSAAIALGEAGAKVTVIDLHGQADGASIAITNRAVDALAELGVLDACVAAGTVPGGGGSLFAGMMNAAGEPLPIPAPPGRPDDGLPALVAIYRPELARILSDAARAAGAEIRTGTTFTALADQGDHVAASFREGADETFDLVIGADGTRSAVREAIIPDIRPDYTGWMSFRVVLEDGPEGQPGFFMQPDGDMVATTRLPGNLVYLAAGEKMDNRRLSQGEATEILGRVLDRYTAPLVRGIRTRLADGPHIIARPFEWLMVGKPWHRGRIVVIGDAAHSTTANLSSGGSMAIEDGVVLAQELANNADVEAGLTAFAERRYERTRMVVETSVALLKLQERGAHPAEGGMMRMQAVGALMQPY
ncbi:FAD-dependent monooxygenase [Novosphingobium sp. BL-52-GroH]|uniref:FAD-dependent monooxygenase n=1 Tax=Novosphingobium sp. BL-52-GroH TaxID=3349877 RepID=UPI00384E38DD